MAIARSAFALPFTLNPSVSMTYHHNCMETIESGIQQLLIDANGEFPLAKANVRVSYLYLPESSQDYQANHLSLSIVLSDAALADQLKDFLNHYFMQGNPHLDQPPVFLSNDILANNPRAMNQRNKLAPMKACIAIPHAFIPRFLNEVCRGVSLYSHHDHTYSLVRDFYLVGPEGERITVAHDDKIRAQLNTRYQSLHRVYNENNKPLPQASEVDANHERLNALVHAYHLGRVNELMPGFSDKIRPEDRRAELIATCGDDSLHLIYQGDIFYEASKGFLQNPDLRLGFVSPMNASKVGAEALVGGRGEREAAMARVTNLVPRVLAEAGLRPDHPQAVLNDIYAHLQPTGQMLTLGEACGVYYLQGQTIPEYVSKNDVSAYLAFAENTLRSAHLGEAPANQPLQTQFVPNVKWLDAQGVVRSVLVARVNFSFWANNEAEDVFYKNRWLDVFNQVLQPNHHVDALILHDAFELSPGHAVRGFAEALGERREALAAAGIRLIMPVGDQQSQAYLAYYNNIAAIFPGQLQERCVGGTAESCVAAIAEKYQALGGHQFDLKNKTLADILAHGLQKPRKTRAALLALDYLELTPQGGIGLHPMAPDSVREAYGVVQDDNSAERVKERIVEAYKKHKGSKFDIQNKSLIEILAHALQKDRTTRSALFALNYLEVSEAGALVLSASAPQPLIDAYQHVQAALSTQRIIETIIEAYKDLKGRLFYLRSDAKKRVFDITNASLEDIIAHAKRKDRKTRQAMIALGYVTLDNDNLLQPTEGAPEAFKEAFERLRDDLSEDRLRKTLIAEYHEVGGRKFDMPSKSLKEMLSHAFEKRGKTLQAFMALRYVKKDANGLIVLSEMAPPALRAALNEVQSAPSEQSIIARIIAVYKQSRSWFDPSNGVCTNAFNIYTANLAQLLAHAKTYDDPVRGALVSLGYLLVKPARECLVMTEAYQALADQDHQVASTMAVINQCKQEGCEWLKMPDGSSLDINRASLEQIADHGLQYDDGVRRAMMTLGYLSHQRVPELVMLNGDAVPTVVRDAFHAANRVVVPLLP